MTTFNSFEQTKAWCHTQCPKVALPRGSRSSLQRSERSRETCTERESSSPHGQWCSRNFEVHGRLFCVLTGDCTGRSKSPEIFFFQHVKNRTLWWGLHKNHSKQCTLDSEEKRMPIGSSRGCTPPQSTGTPARIGVLRKAVIS